MGAKDEELIHNHIYFGLGTDTTNLQQKAYTKLSD